MGKFRLAPAVLALSLGLAAVRGWNAAAGPVGESAPDYRDLGRNLKELGVLGSGLEASAFRAPLAPAAFAALGPRRLSALHALLATAEVGQVAWLASLLGPAGSGAAAALLWAMHPALTRDVASANVEPLFVATVLWVALSLAAWAARPTRGRAALLGACLALSLSCRGVLFLLPALLFLKFPPRQALLAIGVAAALLLPWTLRNALQLRAFVPFEQYAAAQNLYAAAYGTVVNSGVPEASADLAEVQRDAFARMREQPGAYLIGCARRLAYALMLHPWLLALAALGLTLGRGRPAVQALGGLCAYLLLVQIPFSVEPRYFDALIPLLAALAGAAIAAVGWRLRKLPEPDFAPAPALKWAMVPALLVGVPLFATATGFLMRESALTLAPCSMGAGAIASLHCGHAMARSGDASGARALYARGLSAGDAAKGTRARLLLDRALLQEGALARADLDEAAALDAERLHDAALVLQDGGRRKEAASVLDALVARYPKDAAYLTDRGIAYTLLGQADSGCRDFEAAIAADPEDARAWIHVGIARERAGRLKDSLRAYDRAVLLAQAWKGAGRPPHLEYASRLQDALATAHPGLRGGGAR